MRNHCRYHLIFFNLTTCDTERQKLILTLTIFVKFSQLSGKKSKKMTINIPDIREKTYELGDKVFEIFEKKHTNWEIRF